MAMAEGKKDSVVLPCVEECASTGSERCLRASLGSAGVGWSCSVETPWTAQCNVFQGG